MKQKQQEKKVPGLQAPRYARSAHAPYYGPETTPSDSLANAEAAQNKERNNK